MFLVYQTRMNLTISRKVWWRGETSKLLGTACGETTSRKQCCVGIYLSALGAPDSELFDIGGAQQVSRHGLPKEALWLVRESPLEPRRGGEPSLEPRRGVCYRDPTVEAGSLYGINDNKDLSEEDRETKIKERFARQGVTVTFED